MTEKIRITTENNGELYMGVMKFIKTNFIIDKDDQDVRGVVLDTMHCVAIDTVSRPKKG